ncbi:transmembrane protein 16K [Nannizzia gypsea CBS 118893]|uniref:Transmembrane protein 16K n=1 Tax=Arthroderma gypseum (strain ATCC MYA-4604 / CBS 118893) TaxID=535722 RepID=E4V5N7_ARTGP|nr:transmembrane protein 16K [Nannizzia gypsea CBS 118893]EFR05412.1 transmembrane protein 16K [Nannizzia gypsea CBS 118893]
MSQDLGAKRIPGHTLAKNFGVEYVILYPFEDQDAGRQLQRLLRSLYSVGLEAAVRPGKGQSLVVLVKPNEDKLKAMAHRTRTKDWLYGVRTAQPAKGAHDTQGTQWTEAERLRTIYDMMTLPRTDGGADITPGYGYWKHVKSIFPLHDHDLNREWIKSWSRKTLLDNSDLEQIRLKLGEKVAFYFTFLQTYFRFLMVPAGLGLFCWVFLGHFSIFYAMLNSLFCLVFVEFWKRQEIDLRLRWQVKGVSEIKARRKEYKHEKQIIDPITGETVYVFPASKRLARQLLVIPFTMAVVVALGTLIATCFAIEVFINEIYSGPFQTYLAFVPTIILSLCVPTISAILTKVATQLTEYENYETQDSHDIALTRKVFVLNFVTSYLPIFLTAFVYVPFAPTIVPYLDVFHLAVKPFHSDEKGTAAASASAGIKEFRINRARLRKQVIYFTVTAQIVNFALETVVPYVKRKFFRKYEEMSEARKNKDDSKTSSSSSTDLLLEDVPEEAEFLKRVRNESELNDYNVTDDLREMCVQFGYLSLFSPVWSLVPVSFLINNWIELRSDFVKICIEHKRPTPFRADSIGPWLDSLSFLSWLGSLTSAALVYMFSSAAGDGSGKSHDEIKGWLLLLTVFFSEHIYLLARLAVQVAMSKLETLDTRRDRAERYLVRKAYLDRASSRQANENDTDADNHQPREEMLTGVQAGADDDFDELGSDYVEEEIGQITRESLEEDARKFSTPDASPSELFWARQRGWKESARIGAAIIQAGTQKETKEDKETKKSQ